MVLALTLAGMWSAAQAETLTVNSGMAIGAGDRAYEGWHVVVGAGGVLVIDGFHHFASLQVVDGGRVQPPAQGAVRLSISDGDTPATVLVDHQSAIDASGLGHPAGAGPGAGSDGALAGGGGGHGGSGGNSDEAADGGATYDQVAEPVAPGSGGGSGGPASGGSGGGVIYLDVAGTVHIDGVVRADGGNGDDVDVSTLPRDHGGGGGAGGSIQIRCTALAGIGSISAGGGSGHRGGVHGGGGGGGRIGIFAALRTLPDDLVQAPGGRGYVPGQDGTVVFGVAVVEPDGTGDYPSIQMAADFVEDNTVILLGDGIFTGEGNRDIDPRGKNLVFASASGQPQDCVIDCQGSLADPHRAFHLRGDKNSSTRITGLTITGGDVRGRADSRGGGILVESGATVVVEDVVFSANRASSGGGGMHNAPHTVTRVIQSVFVFNRSDSGGGGLHYAQGAGGSVDGTVLLMNQSSRGGAGLYHDGGGVVQFRNFTVCGNDGPGLFLGLDTSATIERSVLAFNADQAVICSEGTRVTLRCSDVWSNAGGDFVGCLEGLDGEDGSGDTEVGNNVLADPLFTDWQAGNLSYLPGSPALPANSPCGELIGAVIDYPWTLPPLAGRPAAAGDASFLRLDANEPNPFNPSTTIHFVLDRPVTATLDVYALDGRRVARLFVGTLPAGPHQFTWSGRDDAGRTVPSGTYLCRLAGEGSSVSRRIMLLK